MTTTITRPEAATRCVVTVENLEKRYSSGAAVDNLSFDVPAGEVVGLLGPNGAGKTTAMKMLLGLVKPSSGTASVLGADVTSPGFVHASRRVGALIEAPALYERLTARQNLILQAHTLNVDASKQRIDNLLDLVDLRDRADDRAGAYSLGMKQRLGIAVAMIGNPELVILDEPANGLDPAGIVEIRNLLRRLPEMGTTVLVSSHQLAEVQQACDRLVVLANGRLVAAGTTDEILALHTSRTYRVRVESADAASAFRCLQAAALQPQTSRAEQLIVDLPDDWSGRDLNRTLVNAGVFAAEITHQNVSLESAFLTMTTNPVTTNPTNGEVQ